MRPLLMRKPAALHLVFFAACQPMAAAAQDNDQLRHQMQQLHIKYLSRLVAHQATVMKDMESGLMQQQWQTTVIAILVFVMVFAGIALAVLQFYSDYKTRGKSSMHFKIGAGSLEFKSSVIGLALLLLSMWFFNAYIEHVYRLEPISIPAIHPATFNVSQ